MTLDARNLNPHKPAVAAMWLWGESYSQQSGGSMDFWDSLSDVHKGIARGLVERLRTAPEEE